MGIIEEIMSKEPPDILYHYTNQSGLLGIIRDKKIWATNIRYLNDATEFEYAIQLLHLKIKKLKDSITYNDDGLAKRTDFCGFSIGELDLLSNITEIFKPDLITDLNMVVSSFSEKEDLLSQWRAYAPSGNGFSIGLESSKLLRVTKKLKASLVPCVYDPADQERIIEQCLDESMGYVEERPSGSVLNGKAKPEDVIQETLREIIERFAEKIITVAPMIKHPKFEEEKEWRLVGWIPPHNMTKMKFREGKSMIIPYSEFELTEKKGEFQIKRIIVGPTPHKELSKASVMNLLTAQGVKCGDIELSEIPYRGW